jgi:hypothetical protein
VVVAVWLVVDYSWGVLVAVWLAVEYNWDVLVSKWWLAGDCNLGVDITTWGQGK